MTIQLTIVKSIDFNAQGLVPHFENLINNNGRDSINAKKYYSAAAKLLVSSYSDMYNIIKANTVNINHKYKTDATFQTDPEHLLGVTTPIGGKGIYYDSLDIRNIKVDANGIITDDCILVSKINSDEKSSIRFACTKKDTSLGMVKQLLQHLQRLGGRTWFADSLSNQILRGRYDSSFVDTLYYPITANDLPAGVNNLYYQTPTRAICNLNYSQIGIDQATYNKTFGHELRHYYYTLSHPLESLKWRIIRDKKVIYGYKLGDELNNNGHCSEGTGHEMYNPENADVCDFGNNF
jgi:hypothetical protein